MAAQTIPSFSSPPNPLTELALDELLAAFSERRLPKAAWTHIAHLRVGCCCILAYGEVKAVDYLRSGIRRLNESHGVSNSDSSGYHETLTRFWVALLGGTLREYQLLHPDRSRAEAVHAAVELYGNCSSIVHDYWTFDVARSTDCRHAWYPPDAAPLDVVVLSCSAEQIAQDVGEWANAFAADRPSLRQPQVATQGDIVWFIARRSGSSVGCVAVQVAAPMVGELQCAYVVPSHRRQRVGCLLLAAAKARLRRYGCQAVILNGLPESEAARRLAMRCGFTKSRAAAGSTPVYEFS